MQHRSWLIASVLSVYLGGAFCSHNQGSVQKNSIYSRSANTDNTSTIKSLQNNTDVSATHHVVITETSNRHKVKHSAAQNDDVFYTTQGQGLTGSLSETHGTSQSRQLADSTSTWVETESAKDTSQSRQSADSTSTWVETESAKDTSPSRQSADSTSTWVETESAKDTSQSRQSADSTSTWVETESAKDTSQSTDFVSPAHGHEHVISSVHRREGLMSPISDNDEFKPPSPTSEVVTSSPPGSEDLISPSHGAGMLILPAHQREELISPTTESDNLKHIQSHTTDSVKKVQGIEEWMHSMLNDEIMKNEGSVHPKLEDGDPTKKKAHNLKQKGPKSKHIVETTSQKHNLEDPAPQSEDAPRAVGASERLKATVSQSDGVTRQQSEGMKAIVSQSDGLTRQQSEGLMINVDKRDRSTHFTTDRRNQARYNESVTHANLPGRSTMHTTEQGGLWRTTQQDGGMLHTTQSEGLLHTTQQDGGMLHTTQSEGLLRTTQQNGGMLHTTQQNNDFTNTQLQDEDTVYTVSSATDLSDKLQKDLKHGRRKQHGEDLIDIPFMTTETSVHKSQLDEEFEYPADTDAQFLHTTTQDEDHAITSQQHVKLPQIVKKEGNFLSRKQHHEEEIRLTTQTDEDDFSVTTQQSDGLTSRTTLPTVLQASDSTQNQYGSDLVQSTTDKYLTYHSYYIASSLPNIPGEDEVHTTLEDNDLVHQTTEPDDSLHIAHQDDGVKHNTTLDADLAHTVEQHKHRTQQTNSENTDYTRHYDNTEVQELPNHDDVMRQITRQKITQAIQNKNTADTMNVSEKLSESTPSGMSLMSSKTEVSYQRNTRNEPNDPSKYSVYSNVADVIRENRMSTVNTEFTYGKVWTGDTGGMIKPRTPNITSTPRNNVTNRAPVIGDQTADSILTPVIGDQTADSILTPVIGDQTADSILTPVIGDQTADSILTPVIGDQTADSILTPVIGDQTADSILTPVIGDQTADSILTPVIGDQTADSILTPVIGDQTADSILTPVIGDQTADSILTSVIGDQTADSISTVKNTINITARVGSSAAIATSVSTWNGGDDTSTPDNNVATATSVLQDNDFSSVSATASNVAATSSPKLTNHVANTTPVAKDEVDATTQLLVDNVAMTTAVLKAHVTSTTPVTNATQLLNTRSSAPALKDKVANNTPELKDDVADTTAILTDNVAITPGIKNNKYNTTLGPRDKLLTVIKITTNMDGTTTLPDVSCHKTTSGLKDVFSNTTSALDDSVPNTTPKLEGNVDNGILELEDSTTATIVALGGIAKTTPTATDNEWYTTQLAGEDVANAAEELEDNVYNDASDVEDKVHTNASDVEDKVHNNASDVEDKVHNNASDVEDNVDDVTLSKGDYVDGVTPSVGGNVANTAPSLVGASAITVTPTFGSYITSNANLHPQTNTNITDSKTNTVKPIKENHPLERLDPGDSHNQGNDSSSGSSVYEIMEADEPDTSVTRTLLTEHITSEENMSELLKESTKLDSTTGGREIQSKGQDVESSRHETSDSRANILDSEMFSTSYEVFDLDKDSTISWGTTRTDHVTHTHKPSQDETDRNTSVYTNKTTVQGSEYSHSYAPEINTSELDKDTRSTNSELLIGNTGLAKESLDHKVTDADLTNSTSFVENGRASSVVDSYLTSQTSLLRNTKTLPEYNTETMNSAKKTTIETTSDIIHEETEGKTGEASNPLATSSRSFIAESSYCPTCNQNGGPSHEAKVTESKKLITGDGTRDLSMSPAASSSFWSSPELLTPTTSFSSISSTVSASTPVSSHADKPIHVTSRKLSSNPTSAAASNSQSTASFSVSKFGKVTPAFTKTTLTPTSSADKVVLISSPFTDKIRITTTAPTSNVDFTSGVPSTPRNMSTKPPARSTATYTRTPFTSKFRFSTSRPTSDFGLNSSLSTSKSYSASFSDNHKSTATKTRSPATETTPTTTQANTGVDVPLSTSKSYSASFSDNHQSTATKTRSPTTETTPTTTQANTGVDVPLSTTTTASFLGGSVSQTYITPKTTEVTMRDQSEFQTEKHSQTTRSVTTTTDEAESTLHQGKLLTTAIWTRGEVKTPTFTLPVTPSSQGNTTQVSPSSSPPLTSAVTENAKEISSVSKTTLRDAISTTSATTKTTNVTKQRNTTTPTTTTTTTAATTTATTTTTTQQTEMTTTAESTTPSPLKLGDVCAAPYHTADDPCTPWVPYSACSSGSCRCVWPRHADSGICKQYSLTNPGIQVSHVTIASITVTWSRETFRDVQTVKYKVAWDTSRRSTDVGVSGSAWITTDNVFTIDKLAAGTEYRIWVTAVLTARDNPRSQLDLYFSPAVGRTVPSQVGIMNWSLSSDKNAVTLTFDPPAGHFDHCRIVVHHMTWNGVTESSTPTQRFDCLTVNLSPFEVGIWHTIDVTVISGNMSGHVSIFNLTTPPAVPGLVTRLFWKTTANSALLTWRPPSKRNGYITGYDLRLYTDGACVKHVLLSDSAIRSPNKQDRYRTEGGPYGRDNSKECDSSKVESVFLNRNESLGYTFTDLRPGHQYTLELFAQNNKLKGEATTVSLTTLAAVPSPPSEARIGEVTSSSVLLTWKPPEYPGPTSYIIQVFKNRLKDDVKFVRNITIVGYPTTRYLVSDLQYYSTYWFNISAVTSVGESRPVMVGPGITLEKVSDPVSRLRINEITASSVSLLWGQPRNVFGQLTAYMVFVQPESFPGKCEQVIVLSDKRGFQINQTVCRQDKVTQVQLTSMAFNVTDLQPYTTYIISVAAVNGAGLGGFSTVSVSTKIAVPPAPRELKCTYPSRGTISFSWDAPALRTGPITYHILVSKSKHIMDLSQGLDFFGNFTVPESSHWSLNLSGLADFWLYSFSMSSHTAAGSSQAVTLAPPCRTSSAAPGPVKDIKIVSVNATSAQVDWQCPLDEDKHGIIDSFLIYQRLQTFKRIDLDADSGVVETFTLAAGPQTCWRPYTVSVRVVPDMTYSFQIQAKVKGVDEPGDLQSQTFTAPAAVPKLIVILPTSEPYIDESSLKESTFSVSVCRSCLLDSSHGKVSAFGILVCQDGFCDQSLGDLYNWKSVYSGVATWKSAQFKQFETVYRATDRSWELQLQTTLAGKCSVSNNDLQYEDEGRGYHCWTAMTRQYISYKGNTNEVIFEVGNDTSCATKPGNVYCNGPLPAGKSFRVRLFSCTTAGCSVSEPSDLFMTAEPDSQPSSDSVVIGGAVAGIAVAAVVLAVVIGVRLKFRDPKSKGVSGKLGSQEMTQVIVLSDVTNNISTDHSRPIRIGDYEKMLRALHMNDNAALSQEYADLNQQSPQHSVDVGSELAYRHDNRWTNILPFDHSRVKLAVVSGDDVCSHDYINANYISGLDSSRDYIATQGPLTRTVPDFWRMIWEQNVSVIIMLSDFEELDKRTQIMREKVARYFPGDEQSGASQYGLIQVSRTRKDYNNKWEIRTLKLTHMRARKVRILKHFFFKHWSDHEADIDPQELIDFVEVLRAEMKSLPKAPLVVHCSAGVGRTGTFIAVHYFHKLLSSLRSATDKPGHGAAANKTVDIFGRVLKLRDCRRFMVQSMNQYIFVYDAVQEIIRRLFPLEQSKDHDICDKEKNQSLNILPCQGSIEDTVYDDVEQLKGQVIADRGSETSRT